MWSWALQWGGLVVQYCEIKLFFEGGKIDSERECSCVCVCEDENLMKASIVVVFVGNFASVCFLALAHIESMQQFSQQSFTPRCRVLTLYLTFILPCFSSPSNVYSLVIISKQPSVVIHTNFHIAHTLFFRSFPLALEENFSLALRKFSI